MPNHIKNRLTIEGDQSRIDELYAQFSTHYEAKQATSYDGHPAYERDGSYGWLQPDGRFAYRTGMGDMQYADAVLPGYLPKIDAAWTRFPDFEKVVAPPDDPAYRDEPSQEKARHSPNWWYEWNRNNWGTKWNAYSCEKLEGNVWQFGTAWCAVPKIIIMMMAEFPDLHWTYEYADEDTGYNCGVASFNGIVTVGAPLENGSKAAYDLAFKLRPDNAQHYELVDGNYKYKEEEE